MFGNFLFLLTWLFFQLYILSNQVTRSHVHFVSTRNGLNKTNMQCYSKVFAKRKQNLMSWLFKKREVGFPKITAVVQRSREEVLPEQRECESEIMNLHYVVVITRLCASKIFMQFETARRKKCDTRPSIHQSVIGSEYLRGLYRIQNSLRSFYFSAIHKRKPDTNNNGVFTLDFLGCF